MPTYHAKLTTGKWLDPWTKGRLEFEIETAIREILDDSLESVHVYINSEPVKE